VKAPQWHFYVLLCRDNTYYAGITTNLEARLRRHNDGKGSKYTRVRLPVRYVFHMTSEHMDERLAKRVEASFKKLDRGAKERFMNREGKTFDRLTRALGYACCTTFA